nr:ROK family protein [uncultured Carboxylicivirga sp.]
MNKECYIGVDVGGTKMHFAYVEGGKVVKQFKTSTDAYRGKSEIINDLIKGIENLMDEKVAGVGVGVPGLIDVEKGIVYNVQNIPAWKNVELKSTLSEYFNLPVFIGNDANCFLLGEKFYGKGKAYSDLVALAMGTGVGAGVLVNDKLHIGNLSMAGEFGGIGYKDADFENYCSGKFFQRTCKSTGKEIAEKAMAGDAESTEAFNSFGEHVAHLIETIIYSYGPEAIILGGSLSNAYQLFEQNMRETLKKFPHQNALQTTALIASENSEIPVLGAAALVPYYLQKDVVEEILKTA